MNRTKEEKERDRLARYRIVQKYIATKGYEWVRKNHPETLKELGKWTG